MISFVQNANIITPEKICSDLGLIVKDGLIDSFATMAPRGAEIVDLKGAYLAPAFIDLHCHGGAGFEFVDASEDAILAACRFHAQGGTGVLYPTISASDFDTTYRALEALERCRDKTETVIGGVHLEGPYLSPRMCGAQDPGIIRKPDPKEYTALYERFGNLIARWDYAPEEDLDLSFVRFLEEKKIISATAHSAAQYKDLKAALHHGNRLVTHLYSCTSTVVREGGFRKLGIIETAFLEDEIVVEAIGDGCHLPPELLRLIFQIKGPDRMCLITDAIRFAGCDEKENSWEGKIPYLIEDGVAKLADRSAFAGSIATSGVLIRKAVESGIDLKDAVTMLTRTPARVMGLAGYGEIAPGFCAKFTVLDKDLLSARVLTL